jgi:hypothetical protein
MEDVFPTKGFTKITPLLLKNVHKYVFLVHLRQFARVVKLNILSLMKPAS